MAAILATIEGKVLIQIGDGEPVEVGKVTIPISAGVSPDRFSSGGPIYPPNVR